MLERLQKIISAAGVTSRRASEELILAGRVIVFSERPARIVAEVVNDLPYPRHRDHPQLVALRRQVLERMGFQS